MDIAQLTQSHTVMEAMETIGCASKGTETWQQCKAFGERCGECNDECKMHQKDSR